jgi:tRNA(Ile)-lysidine synthase
VAPFNWIEHEAVASLLTQCSFPAPGTEVTCAVSGGPDSMALLALATAADLTVTAVHVDHGLRPGSAEEAGVVAAEARRFGAAFRAETVHVGDGPNLEARARVARYGVLPAGVLTGHTADDQAETVLVNLLRGAGIDGLAGIRADERRPLLGLRRADTVALCAELGIEPVTDPSNDDRRFVRNRVRHELLPLMSAIAGRDVVPLLARQAGLLRSEADLLDVLAAGIDQTDARAVASAPLPLARRALRSFLRDDHPPTSAEVERVLQVARLESRACEVAGGRRVKRSHGRLDVDPPSPPR